MGAVVAHQKSFGNGQYRVGSAVVGRGRCEHQDMSFVVQQLREDATVDVLVTDAATGAPVRMVVLAGVVAVAPESVPAIRMSVMGQQPAAGSVAFFLQAAPPIAAGVEVRAQAEAAMSQMVVGSHRDNVDVIYGVGDVAATLTPSTDGDWQWVQLSFACFGALPLGVRYRVTLFLPA